MDFKTTIKLFAGNVIKESNLDKSSKVQLLNQVKESNTYEVMALLMDGEITEIPNQTKPIVLERFKNSEVPGKVKYFIKEQKDNGKIDKKAVIKAATDAAEDIFDEPDDKIIKNMVDDAMKKGKDTEDVIQIVINMMRSDK